MGRYVAQGKTLRTIMIVVLTTLLLPLIAAAQQPGQVRRVAVLWSNPPSSPTAPPFIAEEFRQGLRAHGWVEGHNLTIEWRGVEGTLDQFATVVAEVLRLQVEIIVVPNRTTALIAKEETAITPIVVVAGGDLITSGLIASPARPGGNVTGVSTMMAELTTKQLEFLKQVLPEVTRVAVLQGPSDWSFTVSALEEAAQSLAIELHFLKAREPTTLDSTFAAMTRAQDQALLLLPDPLFFPHLRHIVDLVAQQHLPVFCGSRPWVEAGCLLGYAGSNRGRGQLIASYVDKILKGASPADLPVQQPMKFDLFINLKTAKTLGITMPPSLLLLADEVIQ